LALDAFPGYVHTCAPQESQKIQDCGINPLPYNNEINDLGNMGIMPG